MALNFLKSLSDLTRLQILALICQEQELCVCELTYALNLSQPKVSRHLALLKAANVLTDRRVGKWVYYQVNTALVHWQHQTIAGASQTISTEMLDAIERLQQMGQRPVRQQQCCQ
jgi:ArsR family transcriptional regulator